MKLFVRIENLVFALLAVYFYSDIGFGWWMFAALILLPDLAIAGYLFGPRTGAMCYKVAHTWIAALVCVMIGVFSDDRMVISVGLIWCAHIGFDRALGYGLKRYSGFKDTHLGRIGGGEREGDAA